MKTRCAQLPPRACGHGDAPGERPNGLLLRIREADVTALAELYDRYSTDDSSCPESQAGTSALCCHVVLVRIMALRIVRSLRMHAMSATFFGVPAVTRRP